MSTPQPYSAEWYKRLAYTISLVIIGSASVMHKRKLLDMIIAYISLLSYALLTFLSLLSCL